MIDYGYKRTSQHGKVAENIFKGVMARLGYIVHSKVDDPWHQQWDNDFIVLSPQGCRKYEVKKSIATNGTDEYKGTGNFYIEETQDPRKKGGKGWIEYTGSDFLAFICYDGIYICATKEMREKRKKVGREHRSGYDVATLVPRAAFEQFDSYEYIPMPSCYKETLKSISKYNI